SEAARQPRQSARAPAESQAPGMRADAVELLAPDFGMAFLDRGEPAVDVLQARIGFGVGERTVESGAVDLALQIGAVTCCGFTVRHCETVGRSGAVCKAVRLLAALARADLCC